MPFLPRQAWALLALLAAASCTSHHREPVDLIQDQAALQDDASVVGRPIAWVKGQVGKGLRLDDDVRRTLPASPPSKLRFRLAQLPEGARLSLAAGIAPEAEAEGPVLFSVTVVREGKSERVWDTEVNPSKPKQRKWQDFEIDLAKFAGKDVEIVLETSAYEKTENPRRAFWGAPALQVVDRPAKDAPLVIVYLVDTLRADHTQPYGYTRDTTPNLLQFAKDAVVFETAVSQASWTKPSVASLMTSLLPGAHRAVQLRDKLDQSRVTLPMMLSAKGWATGAAISNSVIYSAGVGFEQGYDRFTGLHGEGDRPSKVVDAAGVVNTGLAWLDQRRGFPTFLYVHTMDPHVPYTPPPPFDTKYEPHPAKDHPAQDPRYDYHEPLDRDRFIAQYDGEIAYGDQEFGRFVQGLKERGLYDRALIVFMGDHGEEFMDHGKWLHGRSVFDELIHIPFIVKFPGQEHAGTRVKQQVQEVDVLPTVLTAARLPVPPTIIGHPLQDVIAGKAPEPPAVAEISHRGFVAHGMRTSADKYIRRFSPEDDELYFDLARDPKEQSSQLGEKPDRVRKMKADLEQSMVPDPFRRTVRVVGSGRYELRLRTGGWIEGVQSVGLGTSERADIEGSGRKLSLVLAPRPGAPREVTFGVRPMGAPIFLEGTRDGKPLAVGEVSIAEEGYHPEAVPFELPDIEPRGENDAPRTENIFAAPKGDPVGLQVWLIMAPGAELTKMDQATRDKLCALGYIGCGPGK